MINKFFLTTLLCLINISVFSQKEKRKIFAKKVSEEIVLDGEMKESFWKEAQVSSDFVQYFPRDTVSAQLETEFRVAYDDKFLYLFAKMEDISSMKFILGDLKRDFFGGTTDYISFTFDTFQDETNGYNFGLSPYNIQREALLSDGGEGYLVQVVEEEEDLELLILTGIPSGFQEQRFMMVIGLENLKSHLIL